MLSKALEMGVCFYRGSVLGDVGGCSFLRVFERGVKFLFYQENFYGELERHVKESSGNGQLCP